MSFLASILNSLDDDTPMNGNGNGALEDRLSQNTYQNGGGGDHQNHNRYKYDKGSVPADVVGALCAASFQLF